MMQSNKQYWAFISYSSKDRRWGEWLHRRLENYPIPSDFRGLEVFDGAVLGKNLRPVFRDRDELSGSYDLGAAILKALDASRFLVVLCSKNAAKSKWVNKEIEDFQALGKGERILALILDGEPNATAAGNPDDECFPPALRYPAEPIAGDMRKEGDGKARGFLKILAGIAQLDFDKLYRRHERQQKKHILISATILISLITGILITIGYAARERFQRQAQQSAAHLLEATSLWIPAAQFAIDQNHRAEAAFSASIALGFDDFGLPSGGPSRRKQTESTYPALFDVQEHSQLRDVCLQIIRGETGRPPLPFWISSKADRHSSDVSCVAFSPNGRIMASASDSEIMIWDVATGEVSHKLREVSGYVSALSFHHSGDMLASAEEDGHVNLWCTRKGIKLFQLKLPESEPIPYEDELANINAVLDVAFSPDGRLLACSKRSFVGIWDLETQEELIRFSIEEDDRLRQPAFARKRRTMLLKRKGGDVAFLENGTVIAYADGEGIRFRAISDGRLIQEIWERDIVHFAISPDERRIAFSFIRMPTYDFEDTDEDWAKSMQLSVNTFYLPAGVGHEIANVNLSAASCLEFSSDGQLLAADGVLWSESHGDIVLRAPFGALAFSPDEQTLVTVVGKNRISLWDVAQDTSVKRPISYSGATTSWALSACGDFLATGSQAGTVDLWDVASSFRVTNTFSEAGMIERLSFANEGKALVAATDSGAIIIYRVPELNPEALFMAHRVGGITDVHVGGLALAFARSEQIIVIRNIEQNDDEVAFRMPADIDGVTLSADGVFLVVSDSNGLVRAWNARTRQQVLELQPETTWQQVVPTKGGRVLHEDAETSLGSAWSPAFISDNGNAFAAVGRRGSAVLLRDMKANTAPRIVSMPYAHTLGLVASCSMIRFAPDGSRFASSGHAWGYFNVWDFATGDLRFKSESRAWHEDGMPPTIYEVRFSRDGNKIVSWDTYEDAMLWDSWSGRRIGTLRVPSGVSDALFHPKEQGVITFNGNGALVFHGMMPEPLNLLEYIERGWYVVDTTAGTVRAAWHDDTKISNIEGGWMQVPAHSHVAVLRSATSPWESNRLLFEHYLSREVWNKAFVLLNSLMDRPVPPTHTVLAAQSVLRTHAGSAEELLGHDNPSPARMNLAHAYLFNDQFENAKAIHEQYLGTAFEDGRAWNDELRNDFKLLREAGHDHPDMERIEALLEP